SMVLPAAPWTISMAARRARGAAAVLRSGVWAGTMESNSGSASETPMPRSNVRRERCFLVIHMAALLRSSHLKWHALHDPQHERREPILIGGGFAFNGAHRR